MGEKLANVLVTIRFLVLLQLDVPIYSSIYLSICGTGTFLTTRCTANSSTNMTVVKLLLLYPLKKFYV